jgi:hypothetical protein
MNKNPERPDNMEEIFTETISPETQPKETQQDKVAKEIRKAVFG